MGATLVVGLIFAGILFFAGRKAFSDMKKGKCSGCSSCSSKSSCTSVDIKEIKF
ncbi:MAG: FeoB-associated Cys-rich membrane protein [Firmicutes bacterium]|nr:FeoB-associated Cys-rich membrane protein [Bacillota bacterium]